MSDLSSPARVVLSIAGSDSSAGAGIQADIKTGAAFGVHVATAITAITAQNSEAVSAIYPLQPEQLRTQLQAVSDSLPIAAIKLGMLANRGLIECVSEFLAEFNGSSKIPVVVDPVLGATSGASLVEGESVAQWYIDYLFPHASVITPNLLEAAQLLGGEPASDYEAMEQQARLLLHLGPQAVLLKGGHSHGPQAADVLVNAEGLWPYTSARIQTSHTHGSGCSLASAIAAGLAQGLSMRQAVAAAKTYIQAAIAGAGRLQLVAQNGPLHHFYQYW